MQVGWVGASGRSRSRCYEAVSGRCPCRGIVAARRASPTSHCTCLRKPAASRMQRAPGHGRTSCRTTEGGVTSDWRLDRLIRTMHKIGCPGSGCHRSAGCRAEAQHAGRDPDEVRHRTEVPWRHSPARRDSRRALFDLWGVVCHAPAPLASLGAGVEEGGLSSGPVDGCTGRLGAVQVVLEHVLRSSFTAGISIVIRARPRRGAGRVVSSGVGRGRRIGGARFSTVKLPHYRPSQPGVLLPQPDERGLPATRLRQSLAHSDVHRSQERAVRRRTHWPRRRSWSVGTDFSGRRRPRLAGPTACPYRLPYCDGNGLYLNVETSGSRRWVQPLVIRGKSCTLGLGRLQARVAGRGA